MVMKMKELPCKNCILFAMCNALLKAKLDPIEEPTDLNITIAFATALIGCKLASEYIDDKFYNVRDTAKLKEVTASELRKVYDFDR